MSWQSDPRSTEELIELALKSENDNNLVAILHFRGNQEVFQAASKLCNSHNPQERQLGADILGQLGIPHRAFLNESLTILLRLIECEQNTDVLNSIGIAFGHLHDVRTIAPLIRLKSHPSPSVRYGVVFGLLGYEDELAISTLIELSSDQDEEVGNWATFGLGSQIETDTTAIRKALYQRFVNENTDENYEISGEALVGLAKRKDSRILTRLIEELLSDYVGVLAVEAAEEFADSRLYPALMQLQQWWTKDNDLLESAINNCQEET
ncbi:MAG: hypothetical protein V7K48_22325 [Nostoc sp.]|uniref:hypothetical protein n=1 Tax=Nostoc sp. TaxID=1180 RepID=UPI002FF65A9D